MAVKRRKLGRRKSIRRKSRVRSLFGGYMGDGRGFEVTMDKSHLIDDKKKFLEDHEKSKPSKFWLPSYIDHKVNKNVIDDTTMNNLLLEMNSNDQARRNLAREQLKDLLIMRDIEKNPDEYMREWLQGKHKKNTWVKTAARVGLGTAAALALGYGAYQWGTPMLGMLSSGYNWLKGKLGGTPSTGTGTGTGKPDFDAMSKDLWIKDGIKVSNPRVAVGDSASEKWGKYNALSDKVDSYLRDHSYDINVDMSKNPGFYGYNDKGWFLAKNAEGKHDWVHGEDLLAWLENQDNETIKKLYPGLNSEFRDLRKLADNYYGKGFRMTKRGRQLLKRYRKCLRRKRC